jgi:PhzF family phenazine biosynthesis protein
MAGQRPASQIPLYQVDAFTGRVFAGNPAAVCPLERWLDADTMQAIAAETNLSETAFFVGGSGRYELRWFTPATEVDLCGHATLASSFIIWNRLRDGSAALSFGTRSGELRVERRGDLLVMDLPLAPPRRCDPPPELAAGLGSPALEIWEAKEGEGSRNFLAVFGSEEEVRALDPDPRPLARLRRTGVIATAPGRSTDFVSRYFAPSFGITEDPVTGSAHCTLAPYWAERLGRKTLHARQISPRGGEIFCELEEDRVRVGGRAALFSEGVIHL